MRLNLFLAIFLSVNNSWIFAEIASPSRSGSVARSTLSADLLRAAQHYHELGHWWCELFLLMPDHVHMLLSVPPKYSVSNVMGFIKGKSAIHIARVYAGRRRNYVGQHFWARGYWVSTVGKNEAAVRQYIQNQEKEDKRLEQLELGAL